MSPRPDVSEERKKQILEAAIVVFARLGFQQTRMEDIANQARLSKGTLYLYFKSKDAVVIALLKHLFVEEFNLSDVLGESQSQQSARERLLNLPHLFIAALQELTKLLPIAFEFYALAGRDAEVRQFLTTYFDTYRQELVQLIQQGIERGEFREVDVEATAITFLALCEGLLLLFFMNPQAYDWPEIIERSFRGVLEGLENKKGRGSP